MPTCKLCQKEKRLHKSHIIPEFLYKSLYDENSHRFHCISSLPEKENTWKQKGEWDRLLCSDCEQRISKLERYASLVLMGGAEIEIEVHRGAFNFGGIDYKQFKLFQLSILWRAAVSNRPMFRMVNLGKHEEIIRNMLLSANPGEVYNYGCIMCATMHDRNHIDSIIIQPELTRVDGQIVYRFVFSGFWWLFFCSSHRPTTEVSNMFLQSSGSVCVFQKELGSAEHVVRFAVSSQPLREI